MHPVTFNSLYKLVTAGKLDKVQFLQEIRKNPTLSTHVDTNLPFDQVIKYLSGKQLLAVNQKAESTAFDLKSYIKESKSKRTITRDEAHPYQYQTGIKCEMEKNGNDFEKAELTVLKNLTKDAYHYTNVTKSTINDPNGLDHVLKESLDDITSKEGHDFSEFIGKAFLNGHVSEIKPSQDGSAYFIYTKGDHNVICYSVTDDKVTYDQGMPISMLSMSEDNANLIIYLAKMVNPNKITRLHRNDFKIDIKDRDPRNTTVRAEGLNELSADTYDSAAGEASYRGQDKRAEKFQSHGDTTRAQENGTPDIKINDGTYKVVRIAKAKGSEFATITMSGGVLIKLTASAMQVNLKNGALLASNIGDKPKETVDRRSANTLVKIASKLGYTYHLDSFNVAGIHSESAVQEERGNTSIDSDKTEVSVDSLKAQYKGKPLLGGKVTDIEEQGDAFGLITDRNVNFLYNKKNNSLTLIVKGKQYAINQIKILDYDAQTLAGFCKAINPESTVTNRDFNVKGYDDEKEAVKTADPYHSSALNESLRKDISRPLY